MTRSCCCGAIVMSCAERWPIVPHSVSLSIGGALVALGVVLVLTVYGELRSISETIEKVPPLRWLDSIGRA